MAQEKTLPSPQKRTLPRKSLLILLILALIYGATGFFLVEQNQEAVIYLWGKPQPKPAGPGLHYTWPAPAGRVTRVNVKEVRTLILGGSQTGLGGSSSRDLQYRMADYDEHQSLISFIDPRQLDRQYYTGDLNVIEFSLAVNYSITDSRHYLSGHRRPEDLLAQVTEAAVTDLVTVRRIDEILLRESGMEQRLKAEIQSKISPYATGISLVSVQFQDVKLPEGSVALAFRLVKDAESEKNRRIEEAKREAGTLLSQASAQAREIRNRGQVRAEAVTNGARQLMTVYDELAARRRNTGDATLKDRLYWQYMETILKDGRIILLEDDRPLDYLILKN